MNIHWIRFLWFLGSGFFWGENYFSSLCCPLDLVLWFFFYWLNDLCFFLFWIGCWRSWRGRQQVAAMAETSAKREFLRSMQVTCWFPQERMQYVLLGLYEWCSLLSLSRISQRSPCYSGFYFISWYLRFLCLQPNFCQIVFFYFFSSLLSHLYASFGLLYFTVFLKNFLSFFLRILRVL